MKHIKKWKIQSNMFFNQKIQWSVLKERFFNEEYFSMKHSSKNIQWIIISMKSIFNETYGGPENYTFWKTKCRQIMKLIITHSIFNLEAPDFAL